MPFPSAIARSRGQNLHQRVAVEQGEAVEVSRTFVVAGIVGAHVFEEANHGPAVGGAMVGDDVVDAAEVYEARDVGEHAGVGAGAEDADIGFLLAVDVVCPVSVVSALQGIGEG